jgi:chromosome segregation ATPase
MNPTIEERLATLEHHALLTDTSVLSIFTEKLSATKNTAETVERELKGFRAETTTRFDAVDTRFDAVDTRFDAVEGRLDRIEAAQTEHGQALTGIAAALERIESRLGQPPEGEG